VSSECAFTCRFFVVKVTVSLRHLFRFISRAGSVMEQLLLESHRDRRSGKSCCLQHFIYLSCCLQNFTYLSCCLQHFIAVTTASRKARRLVETVHVFLLPPFAQFAVFYMKFHLLYFLALLLQFFATSFGDQPLLLQCLRGASVLLRFSAASGVACCRETSAGDCQWCASSTTC
jgi:hypothetical protein